MAKLTEEQQRQLAELEALRDAPDTSHGNQSVSITIDLSDATAVKRALKMGLLTRGELDEFDAGDDGDGDGDGDDGDDGDGAGDGDDRPKKDRAPRRRLSLADRTMGATE